MSAEDFRVDGKIAIVTGGGRGIGRAISLTLAEAGADIAVVGRTAKYVEETTGEVRKLGRRALAIPNTDVTQEDQVNRAVEQTITQFGRIDILCNNAGIVILNPVAVVPGVRLPGWEGKEDSWDKAKALEDWHRVISTNLTSALLFARAVGPHMIRQRNGRVVNTSSTSDNVGMPYFSAYCASKAGLSSFTRCLASEWAPFNIRVNAVSPGWVNTDLAKPYMADPEFSKMVHEAIPLGRVAEPKEVALAVLFLASEASSYLTGEIITVDGGVMGHGPNT